MDVVERFHEIMKPIIKEEKKKPKILFHGKYKEYPNKNNPYIIFSPKNYHPKPITSPKDLNFSEEQWNQFDRNARKGVVPFCL
ncbi:MAG: hypothetical protein EZS28_038677 [Streblomastix strix]|uniref:Uncharacterized protein n=1 Tax=Streblomastix strix TaxID=222440 RepID=A0A5J4U7X4_9EUKA|nr:MAG: hypothetical protein EZS28_038677 [Streblomastix strix]